MATDTFQVSHPLHVLETKIMIVHVQVEHCNLIGRRNNLPFRCVTDISDVIHPLIEVMIDHVLASKTLLNYYMYRIELQRALYTVI